MEYPLATGKSSPIWPDVFITGELPEGTKRMQAASMAYTGLALCYLEAAPENFRKGMVAIEQLIGFAPTEEELERNKAKIDEWVRNRE